MLELGETGIELNFCRMVRGLSLYRKLDFVDCRTSGFLKRVLMYKAYLSSDFYGHFS